MVADVTYVGRMGLHLQRERNINQLQPGTVQANPGVNVNALRPYLGFATIRLSENAGRSIYHGLQLNLERRFRNGLGFGVAYTLLAAARQRLRQARTCSSTPTTTAGTGRVSDNDRTHLFNVHYLYELPFWRKQDTLVKKILGGWQVSGVTYFQSGLPLPIWRARRHRRRRRHHRPALGPRRRSRRSTTRSSRTAAPSTRTSGSTRPAFARPAAGTFGNAGRNPDGLRGAGLPELGHRALQEHPARRHASASSSGWRRSTSSTTRSWATRTRDRRRRAGPRARWAASTSIPRSADFGRVLTKTSERNIQLGVKFSF